MTARTTQVAGIFRTYVALVGLLCLTACASRLPSGWYSTPLALAAATGKLVIIFLSFMHLSRQKPLVRIFAVAGFFWLAVLLVLAASDYFTRGWTI
jgi:cytochrome c oxidase subunit 4